MSPNICYKTKFSRSENFDETRAEGESAAGLRRYQY